MTRHCLVALLLTASLLSCRGRGDVVDVSVTDTLPVEAEVQDTLPRTSITFILGDDKWAYNQYYDMAAHYYRLDPDDRTEAVVEGLTSLTQVMAWLQAHPDTSGRPYGLINLVSHGNEFIDLQMTVTPRGHRLSAQTLRQALADSVVAPPDSSLVDARTLVFLHGCAVGNNRSLLDALADAFGGRATVTASKLFEYYTYLSKNKNPQSIRHYYARTWYAFYHPDSVTDNAWFERQLRRRYPHERTDWNAGLRRRFQSNPSEIYHFSFIVPCTYEAVYGSAADMPSVGSRKKRQQWVDSNEDFRALLAVTRIPQEYFQIKFYRQTYHLADSVALGLKVKARAGVVCLIQPLVATDSTGLAYAPFQPSLDDTAIFAFSR